MTTRYYPYAFASLLTSLLVPCVIAVLFVVELGTWGCTPGTKVAAGVHVQVDPSNCTEEKDSAASETTIDLSCAAIGGGANVEITFPRPDWARMKARSWDASAAEFPGK